MHRAFSARQQVSPADYGRPFRRFSSALRPRLHDLPVVLGWKNRDRSYRDLSPPRSFDPSASPFTRRQVAPPTRPILTAGSPPETPSSDWTNKSLCQPLEVTFFALEPRAHPLPQTQP